MERRARSIGISYATHWDTALAVHALDWMERHPGRPMAVLSGSIHAWKPAVPRQVRARAPEVAQLVLLPVDAGLRSQENVSTGDCDYLLLDPG